MCASWSHQVYEIHLCYFEVLRVLILYIYSFCVKRCVFNFVCVHINIIVCMKFIYPVLKLCVFYFYIFTTSSCEKGSALILYVYILSHRVYEIHLYCFGTLCVLIWYIYSVWEGMYLNFVGVHIDIIIYMKFICLMLKSCVLILYIYSFSMLEDVFFTFVFVHFNVIVCMKLIYIVLMLWVF